MYATAHRLVSPIGEEGTNAFLHLHGAAYPWPDDPGSLIERDPGAVVERATELAPGGNRVVSFLDVLAPDGTTRAAVAEAVADLASELDGRANPTWHARGGVTLKFGVSDEVARRGLPARRAELEFLVERVDRLLARLSS